MAATPLITPKTRVSKHAQAKWDDEKTGIFLELLDAENLAGNRPAGVLTRQGWLNMVKKFNDKTGLSFNKDQLKNRQDTLRREFTKWETLIGKETGLGWDPIKRTLTAPDEWWNERAVVDPSILKYKDNGPVHLDLLQKVFGGVTATGYRAYIPELSPDPPSEEQHLDQFAENVETDHISGRTPYQTDVGSDNEAVPQQETVPGNPRLQSRKRKLRSGASKVSQAELFHSDMESITQTMRDGIQAFQSRNKAQDEGLSYTEALELLEGLPGMGLTNPIYWKGVRVLEDNVRRIAFGHVLKSRIDAVLVWLSTFPDVV